MSARIRVLAFAGIALFLFSSVSFTHGSGRDGNGGHVNRSTGEYHCHTEDCVLPEIEPIEEDVDDPPDGEDQGSVTVAGSWGTTKEWARDIVYEGITETFYCNCDYAPTGDSGGAIDHSSCGYDSNNQTHAHRANRLEWEHVVPLG